MANMKSLNGYGFDASALGGKSPDDFATSDHGHKFSDIAEKPDAYPPEAHGHPWSDITGKPTTFAPADHDHSYNDLKDTPSIPDVPDWAMKTDKPSYSADEISYEDNSNVGVALSQLKDDKLDKTATAVDSSKLGGKTLEQLMLALYPVGAVYISVNSTSPASLFGGTWEQLKDRFLLGAGGSYTANNTGGSASHAHSLSDNGIAKLSTSGNKLQMHSVAVSPPYPVDWEFIFPQNGQNATDPTQGYGMGLGGSTDMADALPPYLAVYMWKRVN